MNFKWIILLVCSYYYVWNVRQVMGGSVVDAAADIPILNQLNQLQASSLLIPLDSKIYETLVGSSRNFSTFVVMTALDPQHNCGLCQRFQKEYQIIAKAWKQLKKPNNVAAYFTFLDYSSGASIFQKKGLRRAPVVFYYPPTGEDEIESTYLTHGGEEDLSGAFFKFNPKAEHVVKIIEKKLGIQIPIRPSLNYQTIGIVLGFLVILLAIGFYLSFKFVDVLKARQLWTILGLLVIYYMISGNMWNHIRGPPYTSSRGGGLSISPQLGFQFGVESHLVLVLYFLCALPFWFLVEKIPYLEKADSQKKMVYLCMAAFFGFFSLLLRLFKVKNSHYPFKLL